MKILVAYASKHGATKAIAERIAEHLALAGHGAAARPVEAAGDLSAYDAFVIGSAAYVGHWLKEATRFVQRNRTVLAERPVWLFSSGPLGTETIDTKGQDVRAAAEPKEFAELDEMIHPRGRRVFFGVLNPATLGVCDRMLRVLPAGRALLPEGDFRDWPGIEAWAVAIAHDLAPLPAAPR
jgi:menaquinone-dependent protoporphyrinogen oxidase